MLFLVKNKNPNFSSQISLSRLLLHCALSPTPHTHDLTRPSCLYSLRSASASALPLSSLTAVRLIHGGFLILGFFGDQPSGLWLEAQEGRKQGQRFQIRLCQLSVTANKEKNIAHARDTIREAVDKGAQLVLLPEIWNSPYSKDSFPVYAEDIDGGSSPSTAMLSEAAKALKVTIVGNSILERCGDRLYNTCCVFGSIGVLKAKHRKTLDVLV
ncbi:hypothetical protein NL676_027540 [Syzygium grande]|nr:hypothetical protein NL676_027540 [Syzygium grande]